MTGIPTGEGGRKGLPEGCAIAKDIHAILKNNNQLSPTNTIRLIRTKLQFLLTATNQNSH
tara:strand:- start:978 stop:1157 length:180 start_codon:yes stop_codon:yes gene_type:complete